MAEEIKVIIQQEKSRIYSRKQKEEELVTINELLENLEVTEAEKDAWAEQELERKQEIYLRRRRDTEAILNG